ncbi:MULTISPECIES: hypothetical protein [unclassified Acidovorax]|uniref:hypothetical protein n=1 Tax=unclassified Acidovorax TaxID=2684926 RepID=UPI0028833603|nr:MULTISPECIES: hypothetical protein [unclassified Acidovorax]
MVTQIDSPDGKPRKDTDRPSPALVETDSGGKPATPAYQPHPDDEREKHSSSGPDDGKTAS